MLYRIYTEDVGENSWNAESIAPMYFQGFTVFKGTGYWRGVYEPSVVIEIVTNDVEKVYELAEAI